jgi:predicted XRE-type DNA-binding protein
MQRSDVAPGQFRRYYHRMNERPDTEGIKAELAAAIVRLLDERALTDAAASEQIGITATEIALAREGKVAGLAVDRLIEILNRLDQRVEVKVSPAGAGSPLLRILRYMAELDAKIPPEEYEKVPTDLAQNLDHYLYGAQKAD